MVQRIYDLIDVIKGYDWILFTTTNYHGIHVSNDVETQGHTFYPAFYTTMPLYAIILNWYP